MNIDDLARYELILYAARSGNVTCLAVLREFVRSSAEKAPTEDLIEIADFILGFLRRHVAESIERN